MESRDAIIDKRVRAVERIKRVLPGLQFRPYKGGPEFQHAADLETIADHLEQTSRATSSHAKAETDATA